jgi:hypothetical protein
MQRYAFHESCFRANCIVDSQPLVSSKGERTMRPMFGLLASLLICLGCYSNNTANKEEAMKVKEGFTESDACKALLKDLKISVDSALGKALLAERFTREGYSGNCIIETEEEQLAFNLKEKTFRIVRGIDPKTGAPHVVRGEFFVSESGELKAHFPPLSK